MNTQAKSKTETPTIESLVSEVSAKAVADRIKEFGVAFDNRAAHEAQLAAGNTSIQDKLVAVRKRFEVPGVAALSIATNMDPNFVNRSIAGDKRFNIYAVQKLADIMHGLNGTGMKNAINLAILKSMIACEKAGVPFESVVSQAAASDKVEVKGQLKQILTRHAVSASTAPTQASSTMNALMTIGAVRNKGSHRAPVFEFVPGPVSTKLRDLVSA